METHSFRAMNTEVLVTVGADDAHARAAVAEAERLFIEAESTLSRFRPESELSRLNRSAGRAFSATPLFFEAVSAAVAGAAHTGGLFDPTVLPALKAAGYDQSFERICERTDSPTSARQKDHCRWDEISLDSGSGRITLPVGCEIDLGGIGKGWTVDRAATLLREFGSFAVDAGGDIYAATDESSGWRVEVEDPFCPDRALLTLRIHDGAVATSSTMRRRWVRSGAEQHHLIDPRSGLPSQSGVVSATIIQRSVAHAEVLAKAALLLGAAAGEAFLAGQPDTEWLLVLDQGRTASSSGFPRIADNA